MSNKWSKRGVLLCLSLAVIIFSSGRVSACDEGWYQDDIGGCLPGENVFTNAMTRPIRQMNEEIAGSVLEQWIQASRSSGSMHAAPLFAEMRSQLESFGLYDDDILNRVRFKVGDNGILNASKNIMINENVQAVTLVDLIVFRTIEGSHDVALWAHELMHVQQYRDWGAHSFAVQYVRNSDDVEWPAYEVERQVRNALRRRQLQSQNEYPVSDVIPQVR